MGQGTTAIHAPDAGPLPPICDHMTKEQVWQYAHLCGYRAAMNTAPKAAEFLNTCGSSASRQWKEGWDAFRFHLLEGNFVAAKRSSRALYEPWIDGNGVARPGVLPDDACLTCEGAGEFESALHCEKCPDCDGTGKTSTNERTA